MLKCHQQWSEQVEYRSGLLSVREEILQFLGCPVISIFGSQAARQLDLANSVVGVILIGHGAPWQERSQLMAHFKELLPTTPVIASLVRLTNPSAMPTLTAPLTIHPNGFG